MFGYLTVNKPKLSEEDAKVYESFYCGLCETLGKKFGHKSQLVLTYDLVFLAVLYQGLYEEEERLLEKHCVLKTKRVYKTDAIYLQFAADMNLMLSYHNFQDKVYDSHSTVSKTAVRLLKKDYDVLSEKYPEKDKALQEYMMKLHEAESKNDLNPDACANLTGKMLSTVFLYKEDEFSAYLKEMFFYLGKMVYLLDAYEDVTSDIKKDAYNPYKKYYLENPEGFEALVKTHLEMVMGSCTRAFEMLPIFKHVEILRNILYSGVWIRFARTTHERNEEVGKA